MSRDTTRRNLPTHTGAIVIVITTTITTTYITRATACAGSAALRPRAQRGRLDRVVPRRLLGENAAETAEAAAGRADAGGSHGRHAPAAADARRRSAAADAATRVSC